MEKGRYDEALERFYNIESKQSNLYEHDNPDLLTGQCKIGYCLMKKVRYDEALERLHNIDSKCQNFMSMIIHNYSLHRI